MSEESIVDKIFNKIKGLLQVLFTSFKKETVDEISQKSLGVRVSWQDKKTDTDIQIAAGATTVERTGILCGIQPMPIPGKPGQIVPCAIVAGDDKKWYMVAPFDQCKIL